MFSIGEFAGLGRVSVRMLRHYDAIGLLRPARVDPDNGYRYYAAAQLALLNRILALKDLGLTLQQVQAVIVEEVDVGELRGMLRLRRAQLAAQVEADTARLARVDARLRSIEEEGRMPTQDVVLKPIPAVRVAELSATAAGYDHPTSITENLSPLYPRLMELLEASGTAVVGPPLAYYQPAPREPGDETITVHAAFPIVGEPPVDCGFAVVELPAVEAAATMLHHGSMSEAFRTEQTIAGWIDDNGYRPVGPGFAREVYLECPADDVDKWVTELQVPVSR
ncbi:MerR family transcriptional regulator [Pseudonocardia humida]|uniref:MerR family transcriptional regulator n=1 Tax=Pseudonocardia humida TaxID=2800819 RepID=A0ABT1A1U9_9PSEU|nr:MerR family transcriptional regulator [Pseudonocardia humida]MCO1656779.1 MerR family transcriptional regulator [Pseudonocardia humida]